MESILIGIPELQQRECRHLQYFALEQHVVGLCAHVGFGLQFAWRIGIDTFDLALLQFHLWNYKHNEREHERQPKHHRLDKSDVQH